MFENTAVRTLECQCRLPVLRPCHSDVALTQPPSMPHKIRVMGQAKISHKNALTEKNKEFFTPAASSSNHPPPWKIVRNLNLY